MYELYTYNKRNRANWTGSKKIPEVLDAQFLGEKKESIFLKAV